MLVDVSRGVQYLVDIKDSFNSAFQVVSESGILADEVLRNVRFNILDATLHNDAIHRGGGQIIPTARRVMYACELTAKPQLMEPIFLCEITCPTTAMSGVYQCLSGRRGIVVSEEQMEGSPLNQVRAHLPVSESFGFTTKLRSLTQGKAFPQCVFSHWDFVNGSPFTQEPPSKCFEIVTSIRKRKGLNEGIPALEKFLDKM